MIASFTDGELTHLDVNGNVEIIMYPEESDSTINKIVNAESSFLSADFHQRAVERILMYPETSGTVTPLFLAKKSLFFLPKFKWFESIRPRDRFDIFVIPDEMEQIMASAPRPVPETKSVKPAPRPVAVPVAQPQETAPAEDTTEPEVAEPSDAVEAQTPEEPSAESVEEKETEEKSETSGSETENSDEATTAPETVAE